MAFMTFVIFPKSTITIVTLTSLSRRMAVYKGGVPWQTNMTLADDIIGSEDNRL